MHYNACPSLLKIHVANEIIEVNPLRNKRNPHKTSLIVITE